MYLHVWHRATPSHLFQLSKMLGERCQQSQAQQVLVRNISLTLILPSPTTITVSRGGGRLGWLLKVLVQRFQETGVLWKQSK